MDHTPSSPNRAWLALLLTGLIALAACNQESPENPEEPPTEPTPEVTAPKLEPSEDFIYVMKETTEYYSGGPQQARPADGELTEGTKVKVIEDAGSYTLVETEAGVRGYVSTTAIGK